MIKDGLFQRFPMEAVFGAHNWPGMPVGQFTIVAGPMFASADEFAITIRGVGAHAAMPQDGVDSVLVACQIVQGFQTIITRNKRPSHPGVISITTIHGGEATTVVPDRREIHGSVRAFSEEVQDLIEGRMRLIAESTCTAYGAACTFEYRRGYPPTVNHANETQFVREVLCNFVGPQNVQKSELMMNAEDFGYLMREIPGCYFLIGNGDGSHRLSGHGEGPCVAHNPSYDFNDSLIRLGGTMWMRLAESWFNAPRRT